jgi:hypothetical protein
MVLLFRFELAFVKSSNGLLYKERKKSSSKLMGPDKSTYPLSANANVLTATLRFSRKYVRPYYDVSVGVMFAFYQQAGSD